MRTTTQLFACSAALVLGSVGCGGTKAADGGEAEAAGAEVGSETDATGVSTETGAEASETSGFVQIPARGITITSVTANPGTSIPIAQGDQWVDGNARNGFLPRDRDTLIRINYGLEEGFTPRLIEARLHLGYPDGTSETLIQVSEVDTPSTENFLDRSFFFGLIAEQGQALPGTTFQVELFEVAEGGEGFTEAITVSPASGPAVIGFEDTPMEINIVFVPITYNGSDPGLTEENKSYILEEGLLQQNPLQKVNAEWHDPVPYTQSLTNLGSLLPVMAQLRQSEGRGSSNWYYAAIVRTGGGGVGGAAGIAYVVPSTLTADRVSANVWLQQGSSTNTIVHEVGHNQGLSHVFCQGGGSTGDDPNYPDPGGFIQQPGFGIRDFQIRPSNQYDYMTYCSKSWVSEWTWNRTYARIRELTSHDYSGDVVDPQTQPLLKGIVHPDGSSEFWTGDGVYDAERSSGAHLIAFELDGETIELPAEISTLSDDRSLWIEVPLPAAQFERVTDIRYRSEAGESHVDPRSLVAGHTPR